MIRVSVFSNDLCLRGAGIYLYSLELATWALGSNRLKEWCRCNLGVEGTTIAIRRLTEGPTGWLAPHVTLSGSASVESLLEFTRTFPRRFHGGITLLLLTCGSALMVFWMYPAEITDSLKLVEFVSLSP
jgi:hypothetical protein